MIATANGRGARRPDRENSSEADPCRGSWHAARLRGQGRQSDLIPVFATSSVNLFVVLGAKILEVVVVDRMLRHAAILGAD